MIAPLFQSAVALESTLTALGHRYCIIGGIALQRWGAPRTTLDVDLTLLVDFGSERPAADGLLTVFTARIDNAAEFATLHRVLLVRDATGTPLDIAFGAMPFEERAVERSSLYELEAGHVMRTCSAEDLVVHKAFAGRAQDWVDIASVLTRTPSLDWAQIEEELQPLLELKEDTESWPRLRSLPR